ncbi:hypothetical protein L218DRAFT_948560 [Marasmius fiardii PR-910]|nr:hypothetical protein L218DRAFT_948560 [Marasmius fiardii PR-910]
MTLVKFTLAALTVLMVATGVALGDDADPISPNACTYPRSILCCQTAQNVDENPGIKRALRPLLSIDSDPFVGLNCAIVSADASGSLSCDAVRPNSLCCTTMYKNGLVLECLRVDLGLSFHTKEMTERLSTEIQSKPEA